MTHEILPASSVIFTQGEEGRTFYIVYKGTCKLYVNDDKLNWRRTCVATQSEGGSFGELALLEAGGTRTATAEATTTVILFKIEREEYATTLMEIHNQDLKLITGYLKNVFLFSGFSEEELNRVASCMTRRRYARHATICSQGGQSDLMFFILRGRCRVIKKVRLPQDQRPLLEFSPDAKLRHPRPPAAPPIVASPPTRLKVEDLSGAEGELQATASSPRRRASAASSMAGSDKSSRRRLPSVLGMSSTLETPRAPSVMEDTMLEIGDISKYQYFGEVALMLKRPHTASVVTAMPTDILLMKRADFQLHLESRCYKAMLKHVKRNYLDNIHDASDTSSICQSIAKSYQWDSYKKRVLDDAVGGSIMDGQQADALSSTILEAAGEGLAGSKFHYGPCRLRITPAEQPVVPQVHRSPRRSGAASTSNGATRSPRLPALPAASPRESEGATKASSTRNFGVSPRRMRVGGYSQRGAGHLGRGEMQLLLLENEMRQAAEARVVPEIIVEAAAAAPAVELPPIATSTAITDGGFTTGAVGVV